jgi:hypothetical protein
MTFGDDLHLLHDCHHRLTPIQAGRLGKALEPYHLFWMEDPTPAELQEGFRLIRRHTTTPIAVGEVFNSVWDANLLITEQLIDYLRMTVLHGGRHHADEESRLARRDVSRRRAATAPRTCRPSRWARRCTSTWPSTTSGSRSNMPHTKADRRGLPARARL